MKLNKFAYLYSKPLGNHTLKIMEKIPGNLVKKTGNIMEISWNFVSLKKWEPCTKKSVKTLELKINNNSFWFFGLEDISPFCGATDTHVFDS